MFAEAAGRLTREHQVRLAVRRRVARVARHLRSGYTRTFLALPEIRLDQLAPPAADVVTPIPDDICLPPYLGPRDHDDFNPLMRIAKHIQPRVVFEFGTAYGNTIANLCRQCPDAVIYTLNAPADVQTGDSVTYSLPAADIGRVYRAHGFAHRVTQIFENSLTADLRRWLPGPVVDLGIIDACHDFEYVLSDFAKLHPYVSDRGIVLFHDTDASMAGHLEGSYRACARLRRQRFDIRHIDGTWWAIWMRDWNRHLSAVSAAAR
jgi:hypothetical protein